MTKAELIERIARSRDLPTDLSKKDVAQVLRIAFDELANYFARARVTKSQTPRFTFPRFGTFTKKKRSARRGVHPRTLEPMEIEACHVVDFKPSRELRETMNLSPSKAEVRSEPVARKTKKRRTRARKTAEPDVILTGGGAVKTGKRRMTPRDEDAEIDALIDDEAMFVEEPLPAPPMQRVAKRAARSQGAEKRSGSI